MRHHPSSFIEELRDLLLGPNDKKQKLQAPSKEAYGIHTEVIKLPILLGGNQTIPISGDFEEFSEDTNTLFGLGLP